MGADVLTRPRKAVVLITAFVVTRAIGWIAGLRFDDNNLAVFMHYLDPELLRHRLLESLWYLHVQPPLFNAFLGLVLKISGDHATFAFQAIYSACGLALYLSVYALQRQLGVPWIVAAAVSLIFAVSPSYLLYEHMLLYTLPSALLITFSALALHRANEIHSKSALGAYFASLAVLGGIRTVFHLVYVSALYAWAVVAWPRRKQALILAAIPFLLLAAMYCKNLYLFGHFTVCTWSGKHLWIKTAGNLAWPDRQRFVEKGVLSPVSLRNRFTALANYPPELRGDSRYPAVPCLHEEAKSTGQINYNHIDQIAVSKAYGLDAWVALRLQPHVYALTCAQAAANYFKSPSHYDYPSPAMTTLKPWLAIWDVVPFGRVTVPNAGTVLLGRTIYPGLFLGLTGLFSFGVWLAAGKDRMTRGQRMLVQYMILQIVYVAAAGVALEILEVHRFRFMTEPFYAVLLGCFIARFIKQKPSGPALTAHPDGLTTD